MGAEVEAPQAPSRVGLGRGVLLPNGEKFFLGMVHSPLPRWGVSAMPVWEGDVPRQNFFLNFYPEMAHFCAFCKLQQ